MTTIKQKADHVRQEIAKGEAGEHGCHWPGGCDVKVPPAQYACQKHWFMIPRALRNRIWAAYSIGQENSKTPSREYLAVVRDIDAWYKSEYKK